ncbi:MAG: hypothetical protein DMD84_22095 [Candidatus Rokuibacteriota bacterium]|nr:MAG: hypothetical protein DMD84_22095 [Candidatus Rokubacteria bacterium]
MSCGARRKLAPFEHAEVVVADFDEWVLPEVPFDLVVAATAFHWLDPVRRVQKCAEALHPGGALAIVETHWGVGHGDDLFLAESQSCYARWDPDHDPAFRPPTPDDLPEQRDDLASSQLFAQIMHRRYLCDREYGAAQYCDLLRTFSNVLAFEDIARSVSHGVARSPWSNTAALSPWNRIRRILPARLSARRDGQRRNSSTIPTGCSIH